MFSNWLEDVVVTNGHGTEAVWAGETFEERGGIKRFEELMNKAVQAKASKEEGCSVQSTLTAEEIEFCLTFEYPYCTTAPEAMVFNWCTTMPEPEENPPEWVLNGLDDLGILLRDGDLYMDCSSCCREVAVEAPLEDIEEFGRSEIYCGRFHCSP